MKNIFISTLIGVLPLSTVFTDTSGAADKVTMGFIYVGPKDDYGYNQAHSEGATGVQKLTWVKAVEEASVPETTSVQETMRNMINVDGATVLFPTSFGYFDPHILKVAKQYPKVQFLHCGGLYSEGKNPKNVGSYFGTSMKPFISPGSWQGARPNRESSASLQPSPFRKSSGTLTHLPWAPGALIPEITQPADLNARSRTGQVRPCDPR